MSVVPRNSLAGPLASSVAAAILVIAVAGCGSGTRSDNSSSPPSSSVPGSPHPRSFGTELAAPMDSWRASFQSGPMSFTIPGAVVGASLGDQTMQLAASGDAVLGSRPMAADDAFHIGSMTKLFTAALIMQLDQEKKLSVDDTIDIWFPTAPNAMKITVKMLLEHESGLYELDFALVGKVTEQQLVDEVFSRKPISEPGTQYVYLNAGYIILGRIAEMAAGQSYGELIRTRFVEPLGLRNTYLDGDGDGLEALTGYDLSCTGATGSDCLGKPSTPRAVTSSPQWKGAWSAGGMVSTVSDQVTWLRALVAGDVVDAAHRALMQDLTPLSSEYYSAAYGKAGITPVQLGEGAGLATWMVPGVGRCMGHAGSIPGSNGIAAFCPDRNLSIAILSNSNPAGVTPGYPGLVELTPVALRAVGGG